MPQSPHPLRATRIVSGEVTPMRRDAFHVGTERYSSGGAERPWWEGRMAVIKFESGSTVGAGEWS
jgi:hypothetical protein